MVNNDVQTCSTSANKPVPEEVVLDDDDEVMETSANGTANGHSNGAQNGDSTKANGNAKEVDCIEIDDDDDSTQTNGNKEQSKKEAKKEPELTNYVALLDKLELYIKEAFDKKDNVDRKLLDALLAAINVQVQKEPYSVRKLILDKQLVLPNTITFPPSQIVDMIIEHDPEAQLSRVISKIFGDERPRLTDSEKRERQQLKNTFPAPSMTKMLLEIGQDLVQESTYSDIVHARNLPEVPKNVETYKQVAAQLKPVWENLRNKNQPFKLSMYNCTACDYKTDSLIQMSIHKQTLHIKENRRVHCGMCPEYNTNGSRMERHMVEVHALPALMPEEPPAKIQCSICEENFPYKGKRDVHMKICKRDYAKLNNIQGGRSVDATATVNRWLWPKPPLDPSISVQQQETQKANQLKQQQQQQQRIIAAANAARAQISQSPLNLRATAQLLAQQQLQSQIKGLGLQQQQQLEQILRANKTNLPPAVLQAVQAQLQKLQAASMANLTPQQIQQLQRTLQQHQQRRSTPTATSSRGQVQQRRSGPGLTGNAARPVAGASARPADFVCEICDEKHHTRAEYLDHLRTIHNTFRNRSMVDLDSGPPLACSRCRDRFWSYEGLERHLVMNHNLVTSDLLVKAQNKLDGGRCKHCFKSFAFNILQHLASDHSAKLCSAEIMFSCDVCPFKCSSYQNLEVHLNQEHPRNGKAR